VAKEIVVEGEEFEANSGRGIEKNELGLNGELGGGEDSSACFPNPADCSIPAWQELPTGAPVSRAR